MVLSKHKMYNLKLCKNVALKKFLHSMGKKSHIRLVECFEVKGKKKSKSEIPHFA